MWQGHAVAVVVPAYDEERLVGRTLRRIPDYVDRVYVVDDHSRDATVASVRAVPDDRVRLIRHADNRGVGAAIVSGYERALEQGFDLLVVMAADDQMDPDDLPALLEPVASGRADYAKGNRFLHECARDMPVLRRWGSRLLSALTRRATGLDVDDAQCGYTALRGAAARRLPLGELWPRYGYPNDLLLLLARTGARVVDVPVKAVYADEQSGLRPYHLASIAFVIGRRVWRSRRSFSSALQAAPGRR